MKHSRILLGLATIFLGSSVHAAPITFATAVNLTGDSDVSTAGAFQYGYTWAGATGTVNGVTFTTTPTSNGAVGTNLTLASWSTANATAFTAASGAFGSLSTAYKAMLVGGVYNNTAGGTSSVTLNNLVVGRRYAVQVWVNDPRSGTSARVETITSTGGNSQGLDYNSTNATGGVGQSVIGTFTADATTQKLSLVTTGAGTTAQINAIQLRENKGAWSGETNGTWDETTVNFTGLSFGAAKAGGGNVSFGDKSGTDVTVLNSNLTLQAGGVTGAHVTVSNSAVPYTFTSADATGFTGPYSLTKSGTGSLTLNGVNTFTGPTGVSGGTLTITDPLGLQNSTLNFTGGTFAFDGITTATLGGLSGNQALALANTSAAAVALSAGGNNQSGTYSGVVSGAGGLTKTGTGTLTLAGADTYTGTTTVAAGGLTVTGSLNPLGSLNLSGGRFDIGTPVSTIGTQTLASVTQTGGTLALNVSGTASDALTISGAYTFTGGDVVVNLTGTPNTGTPYQLVNYGTLSGAPVVSVVTGSRITGTVDLVSGNAISVTFNGAVGSLSWTGANDSNWDTTTLNWLNDDTSLSDKFVALDNVFFDDTHTTHFSPVLNVIVQPGAVTFLNDVNNYVLSGSGAIDGPGTLTMGGAATTILATNNTNTGLNAINSGTFQIGDGGTTGALGTGDISDSGALVFNRSDSAVVANKITGTGTVTQAGSGSLTLSGASTYSGGTILVAGTLAGGGANSFGSGTLTLSGGTLTNSAASTWANPIFVTAATTSTVNASTSGNITLTRAITGTGTFAVNTSASNSVFIVGDISGFLGTFSYTDINNGNNLYFTNSAAALDGSHARFVINGATISSRVLNLGLGTVNSTFQMGELSGTGGIIASVSKTGGGVTTTLEVGALNTSTAFGGLITNGNTGGLNLIAFNKIGMGTLTLSGLNTYTGATTVNAGTLLVTGSTAAGSAVSVAAAGTLGGTGTVSGAVTCSGTIAPGVGIGTLTTGGLVLGGTLAVEVGGANTGDKLMANGNLDITGATLTVTDLGGFSGSCVIAQCTGTLTGTFASPPAGYTLGYTATQVTLTKSSGGFDTWVGGFGSLPGDKRGSLDDYDADGLPNLLEYVLGGNPTVSDGGTIVPASAISGGNLVFSYNRFDDSLGDTTQVVQYGNDLVGWTDIPIGAMGVGMVAIMDHGATDTVTVTIPMSGTKMFARLKVTKN